MKQRQTDRCSFDEPEGGTESLALYAWAGIAALSALAACISILMPISNPTLELVRNTSNSQNEEVATAPKPDIVPPKEDPLRVAGAQKTTPIDDSEVDKLLEKYRETTENPDPVTTAAVSGEIEDDLAEDLRPAQLFPGVDAIGATIGLSKSVPELASRYAALERRAPDLFEAIDPLVEVVEDGERLEARLVAGPFAEQEELSEFCRELRLRITIDCVAGDYSGEPLTR